jgi:exopolysaccharide biosynthesis WecB/TagA/CpsF family protein
MSYPHRKAFSDIVTPIVRKPLPAHHEPIEVTEVPSSAHRASTTKDATNEQIAYVPHDRPSRNRQYDWNRPGLSRAMPAYFPSKVAWLFERLIIVNGADGRRNLIDALESPETPIIVGFVNAHAFNLTWTDAAVRLAFSSCEIILRDGVGIKMFLRLYGISGGENMNGTDFIPQLLQAFKSKKIVLFGTRLTNLASAANEMRSQGFNIQYTLDGFHPVDHYITTALALKADIILLGMGMPRQEMIADRLREALSHGCLIINGGGSIDFMSKHVPRSPRLMRTLGLEWLFRLVLEPRRLFNRYVLGNPLFIVRAIRARLRLI